MARIKIKDLPKDIKIRKKQMKQILGGYNSLELLAAVAHHKAASAASDLSSIAQEQEDMLAAKKAIRDVQRAYDSLTQDDDESGLKLKSALLDVSCSTTKQ